MSMHGTPGPVSAGVTTAARCVLRRGDVDDAEPVKLLPDGILPLRTGPGGVEDPGHLAGGHTERAIVISNDRVARPDQLAPDTDRHVDRAGRGLHGALGA